jgi:hypothetical protein
MATFNSDADDVQFLEPTRPARDKAREQIRITPRAARADSRQIERRQPQYLKLDHIPHLRNPVMVMAFEGWNDAGEAASTAARLIVSQRDKSRIATVDPEEFFAFTDTRPHVRLTRRGRRKIDWPTNEFFACTDPSDDPEARDLLILLGTEPDLRWRTFTDLVLGLAKRCGVELVIALGSLYADVPHTMPIRVSGSSANAEKHPLSRNLNYKPSKYEGPTGIISVLTSRFADDGYPVVSLWGFAPHYISASPNPMVAARMLRETSSLLETPLETDMIDEAAQRFDEQVREAVARDPEAMAYVRDLEREAKEEEDNDDDGQDRAMSRGELPSGPAMVDALEEFLRKRQRPPGASAQ